MRGPGGAPMRLAKTSNNMPQEPPTLRAPPLAAPEASQTGGEFDLAMGLLGVFNDKLASQFSVQQAAAKFAAAPPMWSSRPLAWSPGLAGAAPVSTGLPGFKTGLELASTSLSAYGAPDSLGETLGAAGTAAAGWWSYYERAKAGDMTTAEHMAAAFTPGFATLSVAMTCLGFNVAAHWFSTGANVCNAVNAGLQMTHKRK